MTKVRKKSRVVFGSFEQFKAELFPRLSDEEKKKATSWDSRQHGVSLADSAIEDLLKQPRKQPRSGDA